MKHTLINSAQLAQGRALAKKLVPDYRFTESYDELVLPDLFEEGRTFLFLMQKPPTAAELKEIQQISGRRVIFVAEKLPSAHPFVAWIKKEGELIDLVAETPWDKQRRLEKEIRGKVKEIEPLALKALLQLPEEQIDSEIEKLLTYNETITLQAVTLLVPQAETASVWSFLDALLQKDAKKALSLNLGTQESLFGLFRLVRNQYRNLLLLKSAPPGEKRQTLGHLKDKGYSVLESASGRFTIPQLEKILIKLDHLDFMMRDGHTDEPLLLTLMVSYTC